MGPSASSQHDSCPVHVCFSVYNVVKKGDFVARICSMNSSMNSGQKTNIVAS